MREFGGLFSLCAILGACASGDPKTDPVIAKYDIQTGYVVTTNVPNDEDYVDAIQFQTEDGPIILEISGDEVEFKVWPFDVYVDNQKYDLAEAHAVGYPHFGGIAAVGWDGLGEPFAVAEMRGKASDFDGYSAFSPSEKFYFEDVGYFLGYVNDDELYSETAPGTVFIEGDQFNGDFGPVYVKAILNGKELTNGIATLTVEGETYPGDVRGLVIQDAENERVGSGGAFVSSDPTDEIVFSGAWFADGHYYE